MSKSLSELASETRDLIAQGDFLAARAAVAHYCESVECADQAAVGEAQEFLQWAVKTVAAMRSHALLQRSELSRRGAYEHRDRSAIKTWELVS